MLNPAHLLAVILLSVHSCTITVHVFTTGIHLHSRHSQPAVRLKCCVHNWTNSMCWLRLALNV